MSQPPAIFLVSSIGDISFATGQFTLNGTATVTVANANVGADSMIFISLATPGGTVGAKPAVQTLTPGVGFTVLGTANDTSVYNYAIMFG